MIKNTYLINNVEVILNKKIDRVTKNDLEKITSIGFTKLETNNFQSNKFEELLLFPNLISLSINNSVIEIEDIEIMSRLKNLKFLNFEKCLMENNIDFSILKNLNAITFSRCVIKNYKFLNGMNNLKKLTISFPLENEIVDINEFTELNYLEELFIEGCDIVNSYELKKFKNVKVLYLLISELDNLDFISHMNDLVKIYIPEKYIDKINKESIKSKILTNGIDYVIGDELV